MLFYKHYLQHLILDITISTCFKMLMSCIMAGFHFSLLHSVLVDHLFLLNTFYLYSLKGELPFIRHNEISDHKATIFIEVWFQVPTEHKI